LNYIKAVATVFETRLLFMKSNLDENLLMFDLLNFIFLRHNTKLEGAQTEGKQIFGFIGEKEGRDPFGLTFTIYKVGNFYSSTF
jgi:hypothetical protein